VLIFRGGRRGEHEKSREGPEDGNQCKLIRFTMLFAKTKTEKVIKHVSKSDISG
jgi:hypothetical protein